MLFAIGSALRVTFAVVCEVLVLPVALVFFLVDSLWGVVTGRGVGRPKSVLITGATSGIGAALAVRYAGYEGMTLAVSGRDEERLARVKAECEAKGATVVSKALDVTDAGAMEEWVNEVDESLGGLDLVIANAGIAEMMVGGGKDPVSVTRQVFAVNVDGVLNTVLPAIPRMQRRKKGQIALMASLAGYIGISGTPAYAATKAALRSWGESLRGLLYRDNVHVNVISPGFIKSPLTDSNRSPMPFMMDMGDAVDHIVAGLESDAPEIAFPWQLFALVSAFNAVPRLARDTLARLGVPTMAYKKQRRK